MWTRSIAILLLCLPLLGADTRRRIVVAAGGTPTLQILSTTNFGGLGDGVTDWTTFNGSPKAATLANISSCADGAMPFPVAGDIDNLRCRAVTSVPADSTVTAALRQENGTPTDRLTCDLTNASDLCLSTEGPYAVSAEDTFCLQLSEAGTGGSTINVGCTFDFTPTTVDEFFVSGGMRSPHTSATRWSTISGIYSAESDAEQAEVAWPMGGDFTKLCGYIVSDPGTDPAGFVVTLEEDGSDTVLAVTLNDTNCGGGSGTYPCVFCDTGTVDAIEGGDFQIDITPTGSPSSQPITYSTVFEPTTAGQFTVGSMSSDLTMPTGSSVWPFMGGDPAASAGQNEPPFSAFTIKKLCFQWENGQSLTAGSCTVDLSINNNFSRCTAVDTPDTGCSGDFSGADISVTLGSGGGENQACTSADITVVADDILAFESRCATPTGQTAFSISMMGEE